MLVKLGENEKFQEFIVKQFAKIDERFDKVDEHFTIIDERLDKVDRRLDCIETLLKQHHEETVKTARQVERLVTEQDDFTNFLLRKRKK